MQLGSETQHMMASVNCRWESTDWAPDVCVGGEGLSLMTTSFQCIDFINEKTSVLNYI